MQLFLNISMMRPMLSLWSILAAGSLAFSNNNTTTMLERRQCVNNLGSPGYSCDLYLPTLAQIVARYRDSSNLGRATPSNSVWFYTNLDIGTGGQTVNTVMGNCAGWLLSQNIAAYFIMDGCNREWHGQQQRWIVQHQADFIHNGQDFGTGVPPIDIYQCCYFQAAAAAAQASDAYLFTKANEPWSPTSFWQMVEYPELTRNPNVKRIWRVDPRLGSPQCGQRVLLWDATRGDRPVDAGWKCPV